MPVEFKKHFKKCVAIIDCFEVFCERPKSLKARTQTWSNYKHHNTVKFLIAITPQGAISFDSKGWGGRASDQHITENCGILKHLLTGDQILADCSFNVEEAFGLYCAKVKPPPFTKGKKQFSQVEAGIARQLSRVQIHIKRVIGFLRQKYPLLESTLPINTVMTDPEVEYSTVDKIVLVCAALCNFCDSVVLFEQYITDCVKISVANCIHSSERKKGWYISAMGDEGSQPVFMTHVAETFFPVNLFLSEL